MAVALAAAVSVAGCAPSVDPSPADAAPDSSITDASPPDLHRSPATYLLTLDAGAYPPTPAHPSALVYLPTDFDPTPPLSIVVYLHGWNNCVENIVRPVDGGASCDPDAGTPARNAYALIAQLEASHRNALLLCPEVAFDQSTSAPGNLGNPDGFRALLDEVLRDLAPALDGARLADVGEVVVASHSGGYLAAAGIAARGGVPVDELYLFDSLYGATTDFDGWAKADLAALANGRRFADVYTTTGGTLANSQAMATRAAGWVAPDAGILVDDRATDAWPLDEWRHGLVFKHTGAAHDDVPRLYFLPLLSTSRLPQR